MSKSTGKQETNHHKFIDGYFEKPYLLIFLETSDVLAYIGVCQPCSRGLCNTLKYIATILTDRLGCELFQGDVGSISVLGGGQGMTLRGHLRGHGAFSENEKSISFVYCKILEGGKCPQCLRLCFFTKFCQVTKSL